MEFYLIKDQPLHFTKSKTEFVKSLVFGEKGQTQDVQSNTETFEYFLKRSADVQPICKLVPVLDNAVSHMLANKLTTSFFKQKENDSIDWKLNVDIMAPLNTGTQPEQSSAKIEISAVGENSGLYRIQENYNYPLINGPFWENATLSLFLTQVGSTTTTKTEKILFQKRQDEENGLMKITCSSLIDQFPTELTDVLKNNQDYVAVFTILLVLNPIGLTILLSNPNSKSDCCYTARQMLLHDIGADILIVSKCGCKFKSHKAFIQASSEKLCELLRAHGEDVKEVKIMDKYSSNCVEALLNFIYCRQIVFAIVDTGTAVEVLKASVEFELESLTEIMLQVLLVRPDCIFTVDQALELFEIAKKAFGVDKSCVMISEGNNGTESKLQRLDIKKLWKMIGDRTFSISMQ